MQKSLALPAKKKSSKLHRKNTLIAYSFIAPNFIGFFAFTLLPVIFAVVLSFCSWNGGKEITWVGFDNYAEIFDFSKGVGNFFNKVELGYTLKNTVFFTVATVPLTLVCAIGLALVLNKAVKGAVAFRAILFFPYVASMVAICTCWRLMLMKNGPVNSLLALFGSTFNKTWMADKTMCMWAVILVSVWRNMGYYMVIYLAALQGVPRELYEAATVDGANKWKQFWHITLPQLRPTTFFSSIMLIIGCFKIYDVIVIMSGDGNPTKHYKMLVVYIYRKAFVEAKFGVASAISMVLLVLVLIITIVQFSMEKKFAKD